jgi:hypothetical protein
MAIQKTKLLDPIDLDQQAKYEEQGITRLSNDNSVVKRDDSGNILLQENQSNPLLVIEPLYKKILNRSVVKILDTRFNYFKFPARIVENEVNLDLDLDINLEQSDNITTELVIPVLFDEKNQPQNFQKINAVGPNTWFRDGQEDPGGFSELPFTGGTQTRNNSFTITQPILDTLRDQNKTLRFQVQTQYRTGQTDRTEFRLRLSRVNPKIFREFKQIELVTEQNVSGQTENPNNPNGFTEKNFAADYPFFTMTYIVDATDIQVGDVYTFKTVSSNAASFILAQNCYWDVDVVDIPTTPGIYGASDANQNQNAGVYQFSPNTLLRDSTLTTIAKRSATTNQEIELFT